MRSQAQKVRNLIDSVPFGVFNGKGLRHLYEGVYGEGLSVDRMTTILSRLFKKEFVVRTETQLSNGYWYSKSNDEKLEELQEHYFCPYDLDNKESILRKISKSEFENLEQNILLEEIKEHPFVEKLLSRFPVRNVSRFLAINTGFLMCDGHLRKSLNQLNYTFYRRDDAVKFKCYLESFLPERKISLWPKPKSNCYDLSLCSTDMARFFFSEGIPRGNKIEQSFLVPRWICRGPDYVKKAFLSTVFGNEGSKPYKNRWRIQFVLSKREENVENLLDFLNQIRGLLKYFGISSSYIQLRKQPGRAFCGRFYVSGRENVWRFYEKLEFKYASEKQEALERLLEIE